VQCIIFGKKVLTGVGCSLICLLMWFVSEQCIDSFPENQTNKSISLLKAIGELRT